MVDQVADVWGPVLRRLCCAVPAVVLSLATSACSSATADVDQAAAAFTGALTEHDGPRACALLAPRTRSELEQSSKQPCAEAVLTEGVGDVGAVRRTEVFETMAQVRFAHDTLFLARFDDGWRVLAAACTRPASRPYDCQIAGG
jgi:hypothetical protein